MRYSDELIEEIVSRNDIVEVIGETVRLKRTGSAYTGLCPFHNEKTPSFSVNPARRMYYCFGCHAGGSVITFMMAYHNYTFVEALKYLAERAGIELPEEQLSEQQKAASERRNALLQVYKQAAGFYYYRLTSAQGVLGASYLKGRGLTDETIRRFGLGYSDKFGDSLYRYLKSKDFADEILNESGLFHFDEKKGVSDRFWNRVMFPIMDERGRVIGFGGRVLGDGKPKYLNSPETTLFNKRKNLFALNYARATRERFMVLCEGYMDVITMHQAGFTNAVASLGTALTPEQCTLLKRFTGEVMLMYDSDQAGTNAALRAIPLLKEAGIEPKVVNLSPYKDPDEFLNHEGAAALSERLKSADNALLFELTQTAKNYRRQEPAEWTAFQHEAAMKLAVIGEEMERENYLTAVCGKFGIPVDGMKKLTAKIAAKGTPAEHYVKPKSAGQRGSDREQSELVTQKLMLTYLIEYPEAYPQVKSIIGFHDFTDQLCRTVAEALFAQIEAGHISEAALVAMFGDAEEQSLAASLFHSTIPVKSQADLDRAFTDTVIRLLRQGSAADLNSSDSGDLEAMTRFITRKRILEDLERGKCFHLVQHMDQ